jgi:hypothetical protein
MSSEQAQAVARNHYANFDNLEAAFARVSPAVAFHAMAGLPPTYDGWKQAHGMFMQAFPDQQMTIDDQFAEGDRVVTRGSFMLDSESRLQASLAAAPAPASGSQGGSADQGPSCETEFDQERQADKYRQCRACERQHAGMGSMVADCKNAIARPWR